VKLFHLGAFLTVTAIAFPGLTLVSSPVIAQSSQFIYNVTQPPNLEVDPQINDIIDDVLILATQQGLQTNSLSITIIDVNKNSFAGYQQDRLRYPASVVKLFWLVAFYGKVAENSVTASAFTEDINKMILWSNNDSASRIVDLITSTTSGNRLNDSLFQEWRAKRETLNTFFERAGYKNINISQKTFPISYLNYHRPNGRDLQIRGNLNQPIRNQISTDQAARLMYEIVTEQAILPEFSQVMQEWLTQNLNPQVWQNIDPNQGYFNPIRAFFGEGIYQEPNLRFISKAGWTSQTRQEVAFISNGKTHYVLAVFAEDPAYSNNAKIFPEISRLVYNRMTNR
jgi:hypothetical protein